MNTSFKLDLHKKGDDQRSDESGITFLVFLNQIHIADANNLINQSILHARHVLLVGDHLIESTS